MTRQEKGDLLIQVTTWAGLTVTKKKGHCKTGDLLKRFNPYETFYDKDKKNVTCIKRSPFSCPVIESSIWIEPLLRGHLSYKATFSLSQRWPLKRGLTVFTFVLYIEWSRQNMTHNLLPAITMK